MAYVHRRVVAGQTVEHRKMQSYRVHTKGVKRGPNKGTTTEKQAKINERVAEEHLRWDINANFKHKDLHAVLHYSFLDKPTTLRQILDDKAEFLKILRKLCRKHKVKPKVLVVIETKSMTNPHLHVIISRIDTEIIQDAWEAVPPQGGYISFQSLDNRGNHYKLAHYLVKESRDTMRRYGRRTRGGRGGQGRPGRCAESGEHGDGQRLRNGNRGHSDHGRHPVLFGGDPAGTHTGAGADYPGQITKEEIHHGRRKCECSRRLRRRSEKGGEKGRRRQDRGG